MLGHIEERPVINATLWEASMNIVDVEETTTYDIAVLTTCVESIRDTDVSPHKGRMISQDDSCRQQQPT